MRRFILTVFFIICFLFISSKTLAVTVNISNCPASISDQPFECSFSVEGSTSDINYLRIDLYKEGTSNYFGETLTSGGWYGGSDGKQYLSVSTTSGYLKGKIGTPSTTEFPGSGNYKIKIRRYTSSGNQSSGDQQTPKDIEINFQFPTPTPTPTLSPTPTDTPEATDTPAPIKTPTPPKTQTSIKTPTPTKKPTPKPSSVSPSQNKSDSSDIPNSILGTSSANISPTTSEDPKNQNTDSPLTKVFFISGGLIIILTGIFIASFVVKNKFPRYN